MVNPRAGNPWQCKIEPWEREVLKAVARRIDTADREELEAELAHELLRLKDRPRPHVKNRKAFLWTALRNRALDWIRDRQVREKKTVSLHGSTQENSGEALALEDVLKSPELDLDLQVAFARVWEELGPDLRAVLELLLEERGNQVAVARRSGKHRNTIRHWIRKIQEIFRRHGF